MPDTYAECPMTLAKSGARSRGWKGAGTSIFIDPNQCTDATYDSGTETVTIGGNNDYNEFCCVENFTPQGSSRDEEADEGCLADADNEYVDLGPLKRTNMTFTFRESGFLLTSPRIVVTGETAVPITHQDVDLMDSMNNGWWLSVLIKWPFDGYSYWEVFDAQIKAYTRGQVTKKGYRNSTIELLPLSQSYAVSIDDGVFPAGLGGLNTPTCDPNASA